MGNKKERLTGSEWFSNLMCIKITQRACLNTICFSLLLISLGLLWGLGTCIPTSSHLMLMLLVCLPHFENHWLRGLSTTPEKNQFWGNCLRCPLKYYRILPQSFVHSKPHNDQPCAAFSTGCANVKKGKWVVSFFTI